MGNWEVWIRDRKTGGMYGIPTIDRKRVIDQSGDASPIRPFSSPDPSGTAGSSRLALG